MRQDIARSVKSSADAVGLFRTEIPFFSRSSFPTEDEQIEIYREQLEAFSPRAVTMRTLDIGVIRICLISLLRRRIRSLVGEEFVSHWITQRFFGSN